MLAYLLEYLPPLGGLAVDWGTGALAAYKKGEWESKVVREGIWHKTGSIIADAVIGNVVNN